MKKLQNNFTTPEQSKRLLELGVPEWTADIHQELALCRMINILYGRNARPNKNNRKKVKHLRIFKRG